ncbi:unnamed protein product [Bursaphelenchus okinawaensis]|uniref:Uncharacterized protein n=1 Tax=Bursaphelenchus okinawaensis TaxID=465554 RepID=A0A811L868_9BILA|nr:unnamed protein product [Bursaphelenchus okinawaensis]CAG9117575.1 unnamed protein product [Bursaphelenchus okinawaensis]
MCGDENFCYPGLDDYGRRRYGKPFNCSLLPYIKQYHLTERESQATPNDYETLNDTWIPVFATSVSDNHFGELRKMAKNILKIFGNFKLIVYDLGLNSTNVKELSSWCQVEYRKFNFSKYPPHVTNLFNYAFKMTIIETLQDTKTFFYLDSSGRFDRKSHIQILHHVKNGTIPPLAIFTRTWHSVYSTTHPGMFEYLPLPRHYAELVEYQAVLFVSDSPYTRKALKWYTLCALTQNCIQPVGSKQQCQYPYRKMNVSIDDENAVETIMQSRYIVTDYLKCHRYDQSFWNIFWITMLFDPEERWAAKLFKLKEWPEILTRKFVIDIGRRRQLMWRTYEW